MSNFAGAKSHTSRKEQDSSVLRVKPANQIRNSSSKFIHEAAQSQEHRVQITGLHSGRNSKFLSVHSLERRQLPFNQKGAMQHPPMPQGYHPLRTGAAPFSQRRAPDTQLVPAVHPAALPPQIITYSRQVAQPLRAVQSRARRHTITRHRIQSMRRGGSVCRADECTSAPAEWVSDRPKTGQVCRKWAGEVQARLARPTARAHRGRLRLLGRAEATRRRRQSRSRRRRPCATCC
jgi:hypothetical protein